MTFETGKCANPNGRPAGIADKRNLLNKAIKDAGPELIQTAIAEAQNGEPKILNKLIDKLIPNAREMKYAGGMGLSKLSYENRMIKLNEALDEEKIDLDIWERMRSSYISEHQVDVVKLENEKLKGYVPIILKILKEKGIDLVL